MNRLLIIILSAVMLSHTGHAQMTIAIQHNNILYVGVANRLQLSVINTNMAEVKLVANWGTLTKSGNQYTWQTCDAHRGLVTFYCYRRNKAIDSISFRVKLVPEPQLMIASDLGEHFSIIDRHSGVIAVLPEAEFDIIFTVKEFNFVLIRNGAIVFEAKNYGPRFGNELMSQLSKLQPGDKYQLTNAVVATQCDNSDRRIKDSEIWTVK